MRNSNPKDRKGKFFSDAISVEVNSDHLRILDLEWILRKVKKSSKDALFDLKNLDIPRVPMEIIISNRKKLLFVFLPQEIYDSLNDVFRLTTKTFNELVDSLERARNRENIYTITVERLRYDGDEYSIEESKKIIFDGEIKEKPLTKF